MNLLWAIGLLIVSYALQALTAKPAGVSNAKPSTFQDFNFPQFEEGTPQCVIFGDCWTSDWMVLQTGNFKTEAIKKTPTIGGKK